MARRKKKKREDLKIKIPIRYKDQIEQRFNLRRAELVNGIHSHKFYKLEIACPICKDHWDDCAGCPFVEKYDMWGCQAWHHKLMKKSVPKHISMFSRKIYWNADRDKEAREYLREFKVRARRNIIWDEE